MTTRNTLDLMWDVRDLVDARLHGAHKAILYGLIALREKRGGSFIIRPSVEQIARAAGISRATVIRELPKLTSSGYVVRDRQSRRQVATYTLAIPERSHGATTPERSQDATSQDEPAVGSGCDYSVVASAHPSSRRMSHSEDPLRIEKDQSEDLSMSESPSAPQTVVGEPLTLAIVENKSEKPAKGKSKRESADVIRVWEAYLGCWRREIGKGEEPTLTPRRRSMLTRRLESYSADRIIRAIEGLFASPYHRGQNDTGTRYLEIDLVIRADERVETFESKAIAGPATVTRRPSNGVAKQGVVAADLARWRAGA